MVSKGPVHAVMGPTNEAVRNARPTKAGLKILCPNLAEHLFADGNAYR